MSLKAKNLVNRVKSFVYLQEDLIGKGASGKVYKGMNEQNGQQVAIKIMQMNKIDNQVTEYLLACQKQALTTILNPYVLHAYEIIQMQDQCLIITPLCSGGTLKQHITSQGKLPEQEALLILVKMLRGYVSIKEKGFVHRDIKSSNVMFKNNDPIIIDFGYCQKRTGKKPKMFYNVGSPSYMSPQAYFKTIYSQKSDLWALGIILYQMLQGYTIDHGQPIDRYFSTLLKHGFIFRSKITQPTKNMIKSILNPNPNQRPNTEQLIQLNQRIIYAGNHLYHSIQHSQQIKNTKPESYLLNSQNLNNHKISLKQSHKKHNNQQIQQLFHQKLIESREQYQQIQQLPQKNQQIHKKQAVIQQNSLTHSKMFESRNKNQQFIVKLSQSIYKPQNGGLTQSTRFDNNYPKIQNIPHLPIKSSQIVKHQPFYGHNQQNMQYASSPQFLQVQTPHQYSSLPFQQQQYHQNQIIQHNPNYNVIHRYNDGNIHQNPHSNHPQYITNENPNQITNNNLHQIQPQRIQNFPTQHPQHKKNSQAFHPKNQQFHPKFPPQQFQHHHTNHRNHDIPQNMKLISNNVPRISINKNQFQINPFKLAPQYRSMIQSPTKNNANKNLNIIQNEKNIKICHSKIFNSESILTTNDPTKENITHIQSGQKQHNFKFNNISMADSILAGGEGFKTYQQNLNLLRQSNPVVQSLIFQPQHSVNSSFQSINPVFRSIIVDKQPSSKQIPRNNLHPVQQLRQANQVNIQNFKNIQQFQNVLQVPQFTQIRNSIGHSQQINHRPINSQLPILSLNTQIGQETIRPFSPIARQKIFAQNNQQNKLNININQLERNFFKKTQPYFHMNTNLKEQDHKLRIMPNNIPSQNHQHEVKQQFMNNFIPPHNMNLQKLQQLQRFSQNNNQPIFLARHTMPNIPKKHNNAPENFPPQRIVINPAHNQPRAYK